MENKKELCRFIFKNQEKRTELIKEIEEYLDLTFHEIKSNWKINGELVKNALIRLRINIQCKLP